MKKIVPALVLVCLLTGIAILNSCKKDPVIPTLTTTTVTDITITSGTSGGVITSTGGADVTARGVCYGTDETPTISGSHTSDGPGSGSFTSSIANLSPNTLYYVRAYATNSAGTAYGDEISFTTTAIVVPTLTTTAVTAIALTTAASGGTISADGGGAITAKGVCWATTTSPTTSNSLTVDGTGTGTFTSSLSALLPGTTYYVRAYATNSAGTAYGDEVTFITTAIVIPTLTTNAATLITLTSAVSGGNIATDGGGAITAKGVCWATTANPATTNSKTIDGTGSGAFTSNISGLVPATTYHIRAYATNSAGTAYGNDVTFTTTAVVVPTLTTAAISGVTLTSAVSGGNITTDGGGAITAKGVCWATTTGPTTTSSKTADGTGSGSFVSNLTGLTPGVTYYVRAYATNSIGTSYGNELTFTTTAIVVPTLTTTAATGITLTTAISGGNITADGGGSVTARGVCWATTANPTTSNSKTSDATGTGSFISNLTGLLPGTTYHIRAYATNNAGTAYGSDISFTTSPIVAPTVTTTAVTSITLTTAVSGGNITSNGGGTVTVSGICWATTTGPTTSSSKTTNGALTGSYTGNLTGLTPATTYYVRAYATNSAGTAYGNEVSFTSSVIVVPTLTTTAVTAISYNTASSGGNVAADGGASVTARGVCWATTASPTISNSLTSDASGTGVFTSSITGLTAGTTYHVRAYAINSAGTAYGNDVTFTTTAPLLATVTTTAVTSITTTSAASGGNVTADGYSAVTLKGVCWSTSSNPTTADSKTINGTGTGSFVSSLTSLLPGTTYHIRAYATNTAGTAYGSDVSFSTTAIVAPTVTTTAISAIALTTAGSGGNVTADGNATVTARGVCYSLTTSPTTSDNVTTNGTGTGVFTSNLTGLLPGTLYYLRAYATNSAGTGYGAQIIFTTKLADDDGNIYNTVAIGTQVWMAENLKTTKFYGGAAIPNVIDNTAWSTLVTPAYSWFDNDAATYKPLYGAFYNWFAVNAGNLCPTGWHVPTDAEFNALEVTLGLAPADVNIYGYRGTDQGTQLKNTTGWSAGENGTNTTGWSALPGGYRWGVDGTYQALGQWTYWWSSSALDGTSAWYRRLDGNQTQVYKGAVIYQGGKYVRCMKD